MENLKIRVKILLGFGLVMSLFLFSVVFAMRSVSKIEEVSIGFEGRLEQIRILEGVKLKLTSTTLLFMDIIIDKDEPISGERLKMLEGFKDYLATHETELRSAADTEFEKTTTEKILVNFHKLLEIGEHELVARVNAKQIDEAFLVKMDDVIDEMAISSRETVDQVIASIEGELAQAHQDQDEVIASTHMWQLVNIALGVVLVLIASWFIVASIAKPLNDSIDLLKDIAEGEGDLTRKLNDKRKDEFGQLGHWFNRFLQNIRSIIAQVQISVSDISAAGTQLSSTSNEISHTADNMAQGAEREAAALTQAAATIGMIASAFEEVASQINDLKGLADKAKAAANGANQAVGETQASMQAIGDSSGKIVGIVNVITEIANQTNLLSLNAAIEAAKAGEQGKGFAVVAEEVRNLADRSNSQVDQIKNLIGISSQNVEKGKSISNNMVKVLQEISHMVSSMAVPISQTATAVEEQKASVDELAKTAEEISQVSEANAAASHQLSGATSQIAQTAEELAQMVEKLKNLTDRFRT